MKKKTITFYPEELTLSEWVTVCAALEDREGQTEDSKDKKKLGDLKDRIWKSVEDAYQQDWENS